MARKSLPIGTYQYANEQASSRKLVNCTAEAATPDSGNVITLRRMPGIDDFSTAAAPGRGAHVFNEVLYIVGGGNLYKITDGGISTVVGAIPGTGRVKMADNGTTMVIVTNPDAYETDGITVSQITDVVFTGFGGASDVGFLDGFLVFTVPNSRVSFVSGLNALTFNALDFTTIDGFTDNLLGLIVDHREVIFLKERSTELFYNPGDIAVGFPFRRSPAGFLEIGGASADTMAKLGGAVYWLASDNTVRRLSGNSPEIISSIGIAKFITGGSNAFGFAYTFEDKHYYVLTTATTTLEYDILAQEWHNRSTFNQAVWLTLTMIEAYNAVIAVNSQTGETGKINSSTFTEWGDTQRISWTYQEISGDGRLVSHKRFELKAGTGVGLTNGQGSNPMIELEISNDGGKQFASFENRSLGAKGNYLDRVVWHRLGSSRNRVYRCNMTDPVDLIAFGTFIEATGGGF